MHYKENTLALVTLYWEKTPKYEQKLGEVFKC